MIKPGQLPAQSFQSPPEKYDMKCLGISLLLGGVFHSCPLHFSFSPRGHFIPALRIFHYLRVFHSLPLLFSFPPRGHFIPALRIFHYLRVFHSLPCFFHFPPGGISFLPFAFFIPCPLHFSFPLGSISFLQVIGHVCTK
jgi:hypothetical protein